MQLNVVLRCTHEELYSSMNVAKQSCCLVAGGGSSRMCIIHVVDVLRGHFHAANSVSDCSKHTRLCSSILDAILLVIDVVRCLTARFWFVRHLLVQKLICIVQTL